MRAVVWLLAFPVLASQPAFADVRHEAFPVGLRGPWAPVAGSCQEDGKSRIVIAERSVEAPEESCMIDYVIERPLPNGVMYSGRGSCAKRANPGARSVLNMIVQPKSDGRALIGQTFESLTEYERCDKS